jgi:hypothetical protein
VHFSIEPQDIAIDLHNQKFKVTSHTCLNGSVRGGCPAGAPALGLLEKKVRQVVDALDVDYVTRVGPGH